MAGLWMKLDWDWREDAKVMEFEDEHGKAALVDLIQLMCIMSEFYGQIDMKDRGQRLKAQKKLGMGKAELDAFIDGVAECGLISQDAWIASKIVGSERSIKDGAARRSRKDAASRASEAAAERRKSESS